MLCRATATAVAVAAVAVFRGTASMHPCAMPTVYPQCFFAGGSFDGAMDLSSGHVVWFPNRVHSNATPYPVARSPCSRFNTHYIIYM